MKPISELLLPAACYALLTYGGALGSLPLTLAEAICRAWDVDLELLDQLGIVRYPTQIENLFAAEECRRLYGDLTRVEGFFLHRGLWRLDLDDRLYQTGFLMPVPSPRYGFISHLVAFRHPRDKHPFPVKTRREVRAAA